MEHPEHLPAVAVVTVLGVELDALKQALGFTERDRVPGGGNLFYERVVTTSLSGPLRVQLHVQGKAGNTDAAAEATMIAHTARPRFMLLCGIAAGYRGKVKIGDVVVPRSVVDTTRKVAQGTGLAQRPEITSPQAAVLKMTAASSIPDRELEARFRTLFPNPLAPPAGKKREYGKHVAATPSEHDAAILSDNLLLRDPQVLVDAANTLHQQIRSGEMEAAGFVAACNRQHPPIPWYIVRGISDFGDEFKNDQFHRMAACAAAAYSALFLERVVDLRIWDAKTPSSIAAGPAIGNPTAGGTVSSSDSGPGRDPHQETKRRADLKTIKDLFSVFPRPLVANLLEEGGWDRIHTGHVDVLETAGGIIRSSLFHLYDAGLWELLKTFFHNWEMAWDIGRYSHHDFHNRGIATLSVSDTAPSAEWEKHEQYLNHIDQAANALASLTRHLRETYPDFDLDESDKEATAKYRAMVEQVKKEAEERWGRKETKPPTGADGQ